MKKIISLVLLLVLAQSAQAVLKIEITRGADDAQPIAIVPFGWEGLKAVKAPQSVDGIIGSDLERSGEFKALKAKDMLSTPAINDKINFAQWRVLDINHLVVGKVRELAVDKYSVDFKLYDVITGRQIAGYSLPSSKKLLRRSAHAVSDIIYEKITGIRGVFNTRISYVTLKRRGGKPEFKLEIADADGSNSQTILNSVQPIMSPSWSPDGKSIAYVSFENRRPAIYIQSVYTKSARKRVASFKGINGAPRWSPNGRKLALTLSKGGNADIYTLDIASKNLKKLTRSYGIDTEPTWSPDGNTIYYTSSQGGSPQIYKISATGGKPSRVTFEGRYNTSPTISPDGRYLAVAHRNEGRFQIGLLDQSNGVFRVLTDGRLDESPSFSPNGRILLYATEDRGRGVLAAVSVDGRTKQTLLLSSGDIREPSWAPFAQ